MWSNYILLVYLEMGGLHFGYWYDNKSQLFFFFLEDLTCSKKIVFIYVFFAHNRVVILCGTCPGSLSVPDPVKPIFPNNTSHPTAARIKSLQLLLSSSAAWGSPVIPATHAHSLLSFRTGFNTLIGHRESQSDEELGNAYNGMTSTMSTYSKDCVVYPATYKQKERKK